MNHAQTDSRPNGGPRRTIEPAVGALLSYRRELRAHARLPAEHERELAQRARAGDRAATRRLVESNLATVLPIAMQYRRWGVDVEDVIQQGNLGLLKAIERFDPTRGTCLSTYARHWIRAEIGEYVARYHRVVRLGSSKGERRALRLHRRAPSADAAALAEGAGLSAERAAALLAVLGGHDVSLSPTEEGRSPLDLLTAAGDSPEQAVCEADAGQRLRAEVQAAVARLSAREREVVERRLLSEAPATLEELGRTWGVTKERARQIEAETKARMRRALGPALAGSEQLSRGRTSSADR
jgi:RNA polymerase sigma-32 factor